MTWVKRNYLENSGVKVTVYSQSRDGANFDDSSYDFALFFSTFENRGMLSSSLLPKNSCKNSIIVYFEEKDVYGLREKYDSILSDQVKLCTSNPPIELTHSIHDVEGLIETMLDNIPSSCVSRSAKWFIDIVGSPKPYYLAIIAFLRRHGLSPELSLFHPSAHYEERELTKDAFAFTMGFDRFLWIPWLWGRPVPAKPWTYIFLLGFEGHRSLEVLSQYEPQHVLSVIADPGYRKEYVEKALIRNSEFIKDSASNPIRIHGLDVAKAWKAITDMIDSADPESNICIVPLGPKPHAVAACLAAISNGKPSLLYVMPRSWKVHDVSPGNEIWLYKISV